MKAAINKILKRVFIGQPAAGTPVDYKNVKTKTTMPFNISYEIWVEGVRQFGYQDMINFLQQCTKKTKGC